MKKIPVVAIIGPTASGKSEVAMRLALKTGGCIISGDSMQIYRGMDIGTAKPTAADMAAVKHYLIDICEIQEKNSVAEFVDLAKNAIKEVHSDGFLPIIAGGTGLYIDMLLSGNKFTACVSDEAFRAKWTEAAEKSGNQYVWNILSEKDPAAAADIHPNNIKRVIRALEICEFSGTTKTRQNQLSKLDESEFESYVFQLSADKNVLYERINKRFDILLQKGLLDEIKELYNRGLEHTATASQAIGYKEFLPYLNNEITLNATVEKAKQATRNYAKRQMTYFNKMKKTETYDIGLISCDFIVNNICNHLTKNKICDIIN